MTNEEIKVWDQYFSSIMTGNIENVTDAAYFADAMISERRKRQQGPEKEMD